MKKITMQLGVRAPGPHSIGVLNENGSYIGSLAELMSGPIDLRVPPKSLTEGAPPVIAFFGDLETNPETGALTGRLLVSRKSRRHRHEWPRRTVSASIDCDIADAIEACAAGAGLSVSEFIRACFTRERVGPDEIVAPPLGA